MHDLTRFNTTFIIHTSKDAPIDLISNNSCNKIKDILTEPRNSPINYTSVIF